MNKPFEILHLGQFQGVVSLAKKEKDPEKKKIMGREQQNSLESENEHCCKSYTSQKVHCGISGSFWDERTWIIGWFE